MMTMRMMRKGAKVIFNKKIKSKLLVIHRYLASSNYLCREFRSGKILMHAPFQVSSSQSSS